MKQKSMFERFVEMLAAAREAVRNFYRPPVETEPLPKEKPEIASTPSWKTEDYNLRDVVEVFTPSVLKPEHIRECLDCGDPNYNDNRTKLETKIERCATAKMIHDGVTNEELVAVLRNLMENDVVGMETDVNGKTTLDAMALHYYGSVWTADKTKYVFAELNGKSGLWSYNDKVDTATVEMRFEKSLSELAEHIRECCKKGVEGFPSKEMLNDFSSHEKNIPYELASNEVEALAAFISSGLSNYEVAEQMAVWEELQQFGKQELFAGFDTYQYEQRILAWQNVLPDIRYCHENGLNGFPTRLKGFPSMSLQERLDAAKESLEKTPPHEIMGTLKTGKEEVLPF